MQRIAGFYLEGEYKTQIHRRSKKVCFFNDIKTVKVLRLSRSPPVFLVAASTLGYGLFPILCQNCNVYSKTLKTRINTGGRKNTVLFSEL